MAKRRGRHPLKVSEKVLNNGLYPRQWKRLNKEAKERGYSEAMPFLRFILDDFFAREDAEASESIADAKSDKEYEHMVEETKS